MGLTSTPYCIQALSHSAEIFREASQSFINSAGVISASDMAVVQNGTANMSVNVPAGQIWIPGTLSSTAGFPLNVGNQAYGLPTGFNEQGSYYAWNNGTVNLAIAAADPTNPRIDIVCASVQDAAYSGSNNQALLQVVTGTPAASPSAPNAPASSVVLCQVAVAAGVTSIVNANITDVRPFLNQQASLVANNSAFNLINNTVSVPSSSLLAATRMVGDWGTGSNGWSVPVAGFYLIMVGAASAATNLNNFQILPAHNGSAMTSGANGSAWNSGPTSSGMLSIAATGLVACAAGDFLSLAVYQNTGAPHTVTLWIGAIRMGT